MGYTMSKSLKQYEWPPPISAVAKVSYSRLEKDLPAGSIENHWANISDDTQNDVFFLPKIIGLYYAGRIYDGLGALVQGNYSGISDKFLMDITDIRYGGKTSGGSFLYGVTLNNAPTLSDPWNSTPAWGFPYEGSDIAPGPACQSAHRG